MRISYNTRYLKIIHLVLALIIGLAIFVIPACYFLLKTSNISTELKSSLRYGKTQLEQIIHTNPNFWQYEIYRVTGVLKNLQMESHSTKWTLENHEQKEILKVLPKDEYLKPALTKSIKIFDGHNHIATIKVEASIFFEILLTALISCFTLSMGFTAYFGVKEIPLRALEKLWHKMSYLAKHDELTDLANRTHFNEHLNQTLSHHQKKDHQIAVLTLDLDHFKDVNDTLGHAIGDKLLQKVADDIRPLVGPEELLSRLGGDEFAMILIGREIEDTTAMMADQIIEKLSQPYLIDGNYVHIGASIGIALSTDECHDAELLLKRSDIALYESKRHGRGTYHFYHEGLNNVLLERKELEVELRSALKNGDFELVYQPQFQIESNDIVGIEALLRWPHATRGMIPPDKFIPVAESCGLIVDIDEWVLTKACKQAMEWPAIRMAVNISPMHFHSGNLVSHVRKALKISGLDADRLELEITEGVLLHNTEKTIETLQALKSLGVHIAMDDFGTGYSSLSYLQRFPFDKIKIDRSFISNLVEEKTEAQAIIRAIISMCHAMDMKVNAEGVETIYQSEFLLEQDCQEVQGYLFSKPVTAEELTKILLLKVSAESYQDFSYSLAS